jgi:hypothetical protein
VTVSDEPGLLPNLHPENTYPPTTIACRPVCDLGAPKRAMGTRRAFKQLN